MAETSWAERRGRMVKCKTHGLHFDPELSTGCTRCMREASKAQPTRPPQLVLILLCILGMTAILFYILGPGRAETDATDLFGGAAAVTDGPKLDPEPFQLMMAALESALFRTTIDETDDLLVASSDIEMAATVLSGEILRVEPAHGMAAADLIARMAQAIPPDQVVLADIQRARNQWLQIRSQRFQRADWFFKPLAAGAPRAAASSADYSGAASDLRALIENGLAEVEALSDPATAVDGDPAERWRVFAGDWREQLASLKARIPPRPGTRAEGTMLAAYQDLEQALRLARTLASSNDLPAVSDTRFDEAITAALRAQQGFDELAP